MGDVVNMASVRAALGMGGPSSMNGASPSVQPSLVSVPKPAVEPGKVQLPAGKWAKYAGKLGAALTVTVSAAAIRKGGHEPNEPDDTDVDLLQDALEEGLRLRFGDGPVPWWLGAFMAAGGVYAAMRIGAPKLVKKQDPNAAIAPEKSESVPRETVQEGSPRAAAAQRPLFGLDPVRGTGGI